MVLNDPKHVGHLVFTSSSGCLFTLNCVVLLAHITLCASVEVHQELMNIKPVVLNICSCQ